MKSSLFFLTGVSLISLLTGVPAALALNVFDQVAETSAEGYTILYELEAPVDGGFSDSKAIPYQVDHRAAAPDFDRVAYYMELTSAGGTQWVYVSMDAYTTDPGKVGLPHNIDNPVVHQQTVSNMTVASNVAGVVTGFFIDTGNIEMWPSNYAPANANGVFAADETVFDWGDGEAWPSAGYGSFQIHNAVARQTILAYNRWGAGDGVPDDFGIGDRAIDAPDWTFAGNAGDYTTRRLVILVRPRTHAVSFTELPRDRQLVSRDTATNLATVQITGRESFGGFARVVLRLWRNGTLHHQNDQRLIYQNGSAGFSFSPEIPAELARYDFEILLDKGGELKTVERVNGVVAGDAYLFYGQSNAEAQSYDSSQSANEYASEWLLSFGQNGDDGTDAQNILYWVQAEGDGNMGDPGSIGQWGMVLGRELIDAYRIPVAILNGARGGYSMPQLQKDRANPDYLHDDPGTPRSYNRLRYRAIEAGIDTTARAMFFYQGESDNDNTQQHTDGFARLREDWAVDYPGIERFYVTQVRPGCGPVRTESVGLRDSQRRFGDVYSKTSVMASNGLISHDGCHYSFAGGYEDLGWHHFRQVSRDLYGGPDGPNIDALNPSFAEFTDASRTVIRLVLRNSGATVDFPAGALLDFVLVNSSASITGRTVSGSTILFQLSGPASDGSVLEYRGHAGAGEWVTNANGVGMLSFAEPVKAFSPKEGFAAWAEQLPEGYRGETEDPGGYGLPNILRYAFGMEALEPDLNQLPQISLAQQGEQQSITFTRRTDDSSLGYSPEMSEDLVHWMPFVGVEAISDDDNGSTETVTVAGAASASESGRLFLRLKVAW